MNRKIATALVLLILVNLTGFTTSFAQPQYVPGLNEVYGESACTTCHVNATGGPRNPYGTLFENQPNHTVNVSAALRAIGAPPTANITSTPTATLPPTATPAVTTVMPTIAATETPEATQVPETPGFGIVSSLLGLFALALLAKRNR